jgi:hypothetical protein
MLHWRTKNRTPAGGWRYFQQETDTMITGPHWDGLIVNVRNHRVANQLPIDPAFVQEIEDYMCAQFEDACKELADTKHSIGLSDVMAFTAILAESILKGSPRVDEPEASRRANICVGCKDNVKPEGCKSCTKSNVEKLVLRLTNAQVTRHDAKLESCRHCGCLNRAQVWFPLDILQRHTRKVVHDALPSHCWKK